MLKCGIVGLPNVGKSTLFNALSSAVNAEAANYPFCTIEPNSALVKVPDNRLEELAKIANSEKIIHSYTEFVDIAGLVKGASKGEGLGNKFLSHIREVDAIIHVVRCFEDDDITHVHGKIDPLNDCETIDTELILADLESTEQRIAKLQKKVKSDKSLQEELDLLITCNKTLSESKPARDLIGTIDEDKLNNLGLITAKKVLYVCNVLESDAASGNKYTEIIANKAKSENAFYEIVSSKIEAEIASFDDEAEKVEFLKEIGLKETGLNRIIKSSYKMLNLESFFTVGPKEAHSWSYTKGANAVCAAGIIHTDFAKGFIRAEIINYNEYINIKNMTKAKEMGKIRLEGKDYIMQDGDIVYFRFNV